MKTVDCYNCGSTESVFYAKENGFTMVKCTRCGLLYVRDRPADNTIAEATRQGRHHGADADLDVTVKYNPEARPRYRRVLQDIFGGDFGGIRTWLDVGCGHGEFIQTLQETTYGSVVIKGCEPNGKKQESARSRGLDVSFFDLEEHADKYDMISLLDVYSHLPDPVAFLRTLKKLLMPGGEILLETGDCADFPAAEITRPLCLPDHLSFANERIVVDLLDRLGFAVVVIRKYPYLYRDFRTVGKEFVKLFIPGYHSYLKYYLHWKRHATTNMYVRARLRPH